MRKAPPPRAGGVLADSVVFGEDSGGEESGEGILVGCLEEDFEIDIRDSWWASERWLPFLSRTVGSLVGCATLSARPFLSPLPEMLEPL